MVTSFFAHEKVVTTKQKGKELKKISEKLITRAKKNLDLPADDTAGRLHNKREVMKVVKDRDVVTKLFDEIAPRYRERKGGYTRQFLLGRRLGDAAEMSIVELVGRTKEAVKDEVKDEKKPAKKTKEDKKPVKKAKEKAELKDDKTKEKAKKAKKDSKEKK